MIDTSDMCDMSDTGDMIEYGHEAEPSILGLQIVFFAARRDDCYYCDYYRARQELLWSTPEIIIMIIMVRARNCNYNYFCKHFQKNITAKIRRQHF